nr:MAG TPA: hypothetical protein [Caudoviricetes sp.]
MNKGTVGILCFFLGGIGGSVAASTIWRRRCDDEVESVKRSFEALDKLRNYKEKPAGEKKIKKAESDPDERKEYTKQIKKMKYRKDEPQDAQEVCPRIISLNEAGGPNDEYEISSMTYFTDDVLVGEDERPLSDEDIDYHLGGRQMLKTLIAGDVDSIYIRNEQLKCDYEIIRDEITYKEYIRERPYLVQ